MCILISESKRTSKINNNNDDKILTILAIKLMMDKIPNSLYRRVEFPS